MSKALQTKYLWIGIVLVGLTVRLYLACTVPVWRDEAFSIWAGQRSLYDLTHTFLDATHPPGFYILIHFLEAISTNIYWLRASTLVWYLLNTYLLKKLADRFLDSRFSVILVFLYAFSGYFVLFEWFVRMYVLVDTLILASLYVFLHLRDLQTKSKAFGWLNWIGFTVINFCGLYVDYSFMWYFVPFLVLTLSDALVSKNQRFGYFLGSYLTSILTFLVVYPLFFSAIYGFGGIGWAKGFLLPGTFIPFFLGATANVFFVTIFILLAIWGIYKLVRVKGEHKEFKIFMLSALISAVFTYLYSLFLDRPLFHLRSLQVVAMAVVFIYYFGLVDLVKRNLRIVFGILIFYFVCNFILVVRLIFLSPGATLVDPFPWRAILNSGNLAGADSVKYKFNTKDIDRMSFFTLKYALSGNEDIGRSPIKNGEFNGETDNDCRKFYTGEIDLYTCPQ